MVCLLDLFIIVVCWSVGLLKLSVAVLLDGLSTGSVIYCGLLDILFIYE